MTEKREDKSRHPLDARRESRARVQKVIKLTPWTEPSLNEAKPRRAKLRDCSPHGLGLESPQVIELGEQFGVYLDLGQVTLVLYTVRHRSAVKEGVYRYGAELRGFVGGNDPDNVLAALLEQKLR